MNCDIPPASVNMVHTCVCKCHSTGVKMMFATNPPKPCCVCEILNYAPVPHKPDLQIVAERLEKLEKCMDESNPIHKAHSIVHDEWEDRLSDLAKRIITIENFIGQNYKQDYKRLCDWIDILCERISKLETSLRYAQQNLRDACKFIEELQDYNKRQQELPSIDCGEINKVIDRINKFDETVGKKPHKCPVCEGDGIVLKPAARVAFDEMKRADLDTHTLCNSCQGKGIVWG